jgi:hypothetical protein
VRGNGKEHHNDTLSKTTQPYTLNIKTLRTQKKDTFFKIFFGEREKKKERDFDFDTFFPTFTTTV